MIIILLLIGILLFISLLINNNYNFKGYELIVIWLSLIIFTFFDFGVDGLLILPVIFVLIYYLVRTIKLKEYIPLYIFIINIIMSAIFMISISIYFKDTCYGMCFGPVIYFIGFIAYFIYLLILNIILYIIRKSEDKNDKKTNKKILCIVIVIIIILFFLLGFVS